MSGPIGEIEAMLASGKLRHDGNPVLRWCLANVFMRSDTMGNMRPDRRNSKGKMDGAVALIMAVGRMIRDGAEGVQAGTIEILW